MANVRKTVFFRELLNKFNLVPLVIIFSSCYCYSLWMTWKDILVKWLALQICIFEVPGLNLSLEAGCLDWGFLWSFSVPQGKYLDSILN
jgi:hypothetical protein